MARLFWISLCSCFSFYISGLPLNIFTSTQRFKSIYSSSGCSNTKFYALKFDPDEFIKVNVNKPLGLDLEEVDDGTFRGVYIADFAKDGNAERALRKELLSPKGLFLVEANKIDLRDADFDAAMEAIKSGPDLVELVFIDPNRVLNGPAVLDVVTQDGESTNLRCIKGRLLRTVLLESKIDVYNANGKRSNCGGGGLCGTCVIKLEVPQNDWAKVPMFEKNKLTSRGYDGKGFRLSCNVVVEGDAKVQVQPQIL